MLVPSTCPLCGAIGAAPCGHCIAGLAPARPVASVDHLASVAALVEYDDLGARLVAALKYRNARRLLPWLGLALAGLVPAGTDTLTWAPTTAVRRRERGFDQAELLARAVGRRTRLPVRRLLARHGRRSQTGLARSERLSGLELRSRRPTSGVITVIDDVITTGATLAAAAGELRGAGAVAVHGLVIARTPASPRGTAETVNDEGRDQHAHE